MPHQQPTAIDRIRSLFTGSGVYPLPRGEVWIGTRVLNHAGFEDTPENHLRLAESLSHDVVCLPVAGNHENMPDLGYRYFPPEDLKRISAVGACHVNAVVDGPFQSMVNQRGLMAVFTDWVMNKNEILKHYEITRNRSLDLIRRSLDQGIHGIILTDDLASEKGPLVNPVDIDMLCTPFYTEAISMIHDAGATALLHSCGRLDRLVSLFKSWQLDGLAAIQTAINDLPAINRSLGSNTIIMSGIDTPLLESPPPSQHGIRNLETLINHLSPSGSLILCSSCGLYNPIFFERITHIYKLVERII